jgi:antitoxin component of RelBE/YafQ-DinJ toxin-antitoxin module
MQTSELITTLVDLIAEYGDLPVTVVRQDKMGKVQDVRLVQAYDKQGYPPEESEEDPVEIHIR